ncbi:MAG: IS21 family transposase [Chloroflexi bacterium]|nr:IS21 family transposase [Chloroflexota bacterium]
MITVEDREQIRRAYFVEHKSLRQIERQTGHSRRTIEKALQSAEPSAYTLKAPRAAPVLGEYKVQIDKLLAENEKLPRKQRYTAHKIFEQVKAAGYAGSEAGVHVYVSHHRQSRRRPQVYLPLEFDPGWDAQVDWGEAEVDMAGQRLTVQLFLLRLCYSRRLFVQAYPNQRQESFFDGHVKAFAHMQGVPQRITYDNLKTAVQRVLEGRTREEQRAFVVFRSHYLFDSRFCTPAQGHEKGGIESAVGYARRNFLVPIPQVDDFAALNAYLLTECLKDDQRRVDRQPVSIQQSWALEQSYLRPRPEHDFACCATVPVTLTPYGQVVFETNRYSVPVEDAYRHLVLKAYPFRIDVVHQERVIASHPRCHGREQDIYDPLHYLPLLEQRPGAFEHAKPLRQWRERWPAVYEQLLAHLRAQPSENQGLREFVQILGLHREYLPTLVEQAISQALTYRCAHLNGVRLCLRQLQYPEQPLGALDLTQRPQLAGLGQQPLDLHHYEHLLAESTIGGTV